MFTNAQWDALLTAQFATITALSASKGSEYSGDTDRLANFRRNGAALGLNMETVLLVYMGKHWDSIQTWVKDQQTGRTREYSEPIEGRVDDLITYALLLKAMLQERRKRESGGHLAPFPSRTD